MKYLAFLLASLLLSACQSEPGAQTGAATGENQAAATQPAPLSTTGKQELLFVLSDQSPAKGDTLCLDVQVRDFQNILSMQYSMNWDPKALKFLRIEGFNLKDLSQNSFGFTRTAQGMMGTSWYDYAVQGISLPDGSPIYKVCFQAVGEPGSQSQVVFSNDPVIIEISNSQEQLLGLAFKRANITIQ